MGRAYVLETNEWGETVRRYVEDPPSLGMPDCDMGGVTEDPWRSHRDWQKQNQAFIRDVRYEDDSNPYDKL